MSLSPTERQDQEKQLYDVIIKFFIFPAEESERLGRCNFWDPDSNNWVDGFNWALAEAHNKKIKIGSWLFTRYFVENISKFGEWDVETFENMRKAFNETPGWTTRSLMDFLGFISYSMNFELDESNLKHLDSDEDWNDDRLILIIMVLALGIQLIHKDKGKEKFMEHLRTDPAMMKFFATVLLEIKKKGFFNSAIFAQFDKALLNWPDTQSSKKPLYLSVQVANNKGAIIKKRAVGIEKMYKELANEVMLHLRELARNLPGNSVVYSHPEDMNEQWGPEQTSVLLISTKELIAAFNLGNSTIRDRFNRDSFVKKWAKTAVKIDEDKVDDLRKFRQPIREDILKDCKEFRDKNTELLQNAEVEDYSPGVGDVWRMEVDNSKWDASKRCNKAITVGELFMERMEYMMHPLSTFPAMQNIYYTTFIGNLARFDTQHLRKDAIPWMLSLLGLLDALASNLPSDRRRFFSIECRDEFYFSQLNTFVIGCSCVCIQGIEDQFVAEMRKENGLVMPTLLYLVMVFRLLKNGRQQLNIFLRGMDALFLGKEDFPFCRYEMERRKEDFQMNNPRGSIMLFFHRLYKEMIGRDEWKVLIRRGNMPSTSGAAPV